MYPNEITIVALEERALFEALIAPCLVQSPENIRSFGNDAL